ncbi:MAG: glycosyltransferase family 2 protein, partial [Chloroflexia bacterium]|nr:glycosyltransferase family 2 protein [Chloroflexia bacterium]
MHSPVDSPTVSVVIPVYNVERYIAQCVESVLSQTMQDLEVILVDDGSPDACPQIADDFAARDPRVTVVHQQNQGLSGARNSGLHRARGQLVMFLDSDDYWEGEGSLARCVAAFDERPELDVLFFDALRYYEATGERVFGDVVWDRDRVAGASETEVLRYMVECGDVRPSACTKVIRRQFLIDNELDFKTGVFSEDVEWFFRLITHPATYDYLPLAFYMYRKNRAGSITNTIGAPNVGDVVDTVLAAAEHM